MDTSYGGGGDAGSHSGTVPSEFADLQRQRRDQRFQSENPPTQVSFSIPGARAAGRHRRPRTTTSLHVQSQMICLPQQMLGGAEIPLQAGDALLGRRGPGRKYFTPGIPGVKGRPSARSPGRGVQMDRTLYLWCGRCRIHRPSRTLLVRPPWRSGRPRITGGGPAGGGDADAEQHNRTLGARDRSVGRPRREGAYMRARQRPEAETTDRGGEEEEVVVRTCGGSNSSASRERARRRCVRIQRCCWLPSNGPT